jgi:ABC-2 type transport system permease protein
MWNGIRLYLRYIGISLRSQMQYRASFVMLSLGSFLITAIEFLGIWALFDRFGSLRGWALSEVALFYGMVNVAFATAEGVARGFDTFDTMVKSGDFDRLLLRPRSTMLQVIGRELQVLRIGRFSQGLAVLLWAAAATDILWSWGKVVFILTAILGGACIFAGLFVLQATLAFWTTETLEIMNTMTYGGVETGQYPLAIYRRWFRRFFTFIVPLACINYFPALAILDRPDPLGTPSIVQWTAPLVGVMFLAVALQIWKIGVRHYHSTGS